ncbi:hypothetical protein ACFYY8_31250 [Streptosporangium sp. NPDC001559]|uniref:hypothetical protein n=1 Tax=Streptosporangium sp. NPDC001559 TaxID=3366187 RepID=UPI0036EC2B1A
MADLTPAEVIHAAVAKLRAIEPAPARAVVDSRGDANIFIGDAPIVGCPDCDGGPEIETPELAETIVALLNARERLAAWLASWDGVEVRLSGPMSEDCRHALAIARAINGGAA